MSFALRLFLVMALSLGLVLPRVSAVLAGVAGGPVSVILCDGTGLVTLTLDAEGRPTAPGSHQSHCAMVHAVGTAAPLPVPEWRAAEMSAALPAPALRLSMPPVPEGPPEARAPPVV